MGNLKLTVLFIAMQIHAIVWALTNKATLEIRLIKYTNAEAKDYANKPCDIFSRCDHAFVFCVDNTRTANDVSRCDYFKATTNKWPNQNEIEFHLTDMNHGDANGVANPLIVEFRHGWPGEVDLNIFIEDRDDGPHYPHDKVDFIKHQIEGLPAKAKNDGVWKFVHSRGIRLHRPTSLVFYYILYCMPDYYGPNCETFCQPQNATMTGHYTCDPDTGHKICLPGWENPVQSCSVLQDNCLNHHCQNNGVCVDDYQSYTCNCLPGYAGATCEVDINECDPGPCQNGGSCTDLVNAFSCQCAAGFVGQNCSNHICNDPATIRCLNGGTCTIDGKCVCPAGYIGSDCGLNRCKDILRCKNGGVCTDSGECDCPDGYYGDSCGTRLCDFISCQNGGTCQGASCVCLTGSHGKFCEISGCRTNPCRNDGSCVDQASGYVCRCLGGFTGRHCEIAKDAPKVPSQQGFVNTPGPGSTTDPDVAEVSAQQTAIQPWLIAVIVVAVCLVLALIIILFLVIK